MVDLPRLITLHDEALRAHDRLVVQFEGLYGIPAKRLRGRMMDRWCALREQDAAIAAFEEACEALTEAERLAVLDACHAPEGTRRVDEGVSSETLVVNINKNNDLAGIVARSMRL